MISRPTHRTPDPQRDREEPVRMKCTDHHRSPIHSHVSVFAGGLLLLLTLASLAGAPRAHAAEVPGPAWRIQLSAIPNVLSSERDAFCERHGAELLACDRFQIILDNVGTRPTSGPITIIDTLPAGIETAANPTGSIEGLMRWECTTEKPAAQEIVTCTAEFGGSVHSVPPLSSAAPLFIPVLVEPSATGELIDTVEVRGGGVTPATTASVSTTIGAEPPPFAPEGFAAAALGPAGATDTSAGAHPSSLYTAFQFPTEFSTKIGEELHPHGVEAVKQTVFELPPGLVGDAQAAAKCPLVDVANLHEDQDECPSSSWIGELSLTESGGVASDLKLFNATPEQGYPAEFAVYYPPLERSELLFASVVGSGASTHVRVISQPLDSTVEALGAALVFFGVPSRYNGNGGRELPFFTNPSDCSAPGFTTSLFADSWSRPGALISAERPDLSDPAWKSTASSSPPVTGCESLRFAPSVSFAPEGAASDSPTGLKVSIHVPQSENPEGLATPPLRDATVTLPKGMTVNPSSADGLQGCTAAQIQVTTNEAGTCPQASQLGEVGISTPLLENPLPGKVFLGTPECAPCTNADAQAGRLVKLYIEVNDPVTGVIVKLPGSGSLDPSSGQITASFTENPQLPFEDLNLSFKGGPRATLTTPPTCGSFNTTTDLKPWSAPQSGPDATPSSEFKLTSGPGGSACPNGEAGMPNNPSFEAGTTTPIAGAFSPFVLKLSREDGSQRISSIDTTLPAGLVGRLAGIPYCGDSALAAAAAKSGGAEKASPSCPAASEVGVVNVGAGSGNPYYVQGKAYLAGPYRGAPFSLAIITPAVAGPFDLGTVVVRAALFVNEFTAQVHAVSDPLPQSLAGIPLDVRSIALQLNRSDFTLNPTSCEVKEITGSATSALGQTAALKNRFQVGACGALQFKPGLKISLNGQTKRIGHPALKAVLTYPKGQNANVRRALVNLPGSEFLDQGNLNKTCTRPVLLAGNCPKTTIYGKAKAWTPLLDKPLEGPVYLVGGFGFKLPALIAELDGQIRVLLVGKVDSGKNKGIRNTFEAVPDAPVSRFVLEMKGGKKYGLLENSQDICKHKQTAIAKFTAQNGKTYDTEPVIAVSCGKKSKKSSGKKK
jgi:hypothetical protein